MSVMKLVFIYFFGFLRHVSCDFLHVTSKTCLKPTAGNGSGFGFSIGYQDTNPPQLVIGAPLQDFIGQIYNCPLTTLSNDISCLEMDTKKLKDDIKLQSKKALDFVNPDQYFFLGASMAATKDIFLTCAPLMTRTRQANPPRPSDSYGSCFVYRNEEKDFQKYRDNFNWPRTLKGFETGGLGWASLVDEKNGRILVDKTASSGDVSYVDIARPTKQSQSIYRDIISSKDPLETNFKNSYFNFGYGLTVGTFFKNTSINAVSWQGTDLNGNILFLENNEINKLQIMSTAKTANKPHYITNEVVGSMFGYALAAADLNLDTLSELLVGAPAYSDGKNIESGALHIYIGGNMETVNDINRMRTLIANSENGRFGSAIATNDIDGDNIPEIFVSATYEGSGAVYVLSGYELNQKLFKKATFMEIKVAELKMTQKLKVDLGATRFGFSLQMVKDIDKNGCDELAIGSPGSESVFLFRCLPVVNTTISFDYDNQTLSLSAKEFKVKICLEVTTKPSCTEKVHGRLQVTSDVEGNTKLNKPQFELDLAKEGLKKCEEITVALTQEEEVTYTFRSKLKLLHDDRIKEKEYRPWAVLSPYSELNKTIQVERYCTGKGCTPEISLTMEWTGYLKSHNDLYEIGSSKEGSFNITVTSAKADANMVSIELTVLGVPMPQLITKGCFRSTSTEFKYICTLPKLILEIPHTISVVLDMSKLHNAPQLEVKAQVQDKLNQISYDEVTMKIPYKLNTEAVIINGSSTPLSISDKDIADKKVTISDSHEYIIINTGPVTWPNLNALLKIKKESFIKKVTTITTEKNKCVDYTKEYKIDSYVFHCGLSLKPGGVTKIIARIDISVENFGQSVDKGKLTTYSELLINLGPTHQTFKNISTPISYQQVLGVANNKLVIIIIFSVIALALLLVLAIALYKYGFFQREQKKKLALLRENTRKRSIRLNSENSSRRSHKPSVIEGDHCDIEVVDDCPFEDVTPCPQSSKDDVVLIEEKAQVHS